jgi:hypothetical protein
MIWITNIQTKAQGNVELIVSNEGKRFNHLMFLM